MTQTGAVMTRRSPRWWRQFVVSSRRANVFLWLEVLAAMALVVAVTATWLIVLRCVSRLILGAATGVYRQVLTGWARFVEPRLSG